MAHTWPMTEWRIAGATGGVEVDTQVYAWGEPHRPPLILLHGFMQTGASWDAFAQHFADAFYVVAPDLIGHGKTSVSAFDESAFTLDAYVDQVLTVVAALQARNNQNKPILYGYSMGGRIAEVAATFYPGCFSALMLESAGLGPETEEERLAMVDKVRVQIDKLKDGMESFVDFWEALPLFETQRALPEATRKALRAERVANNPIALALSLSGAGQYQMQNMRPALDELDLPTLFLAGGADVRYSEMVRRLAMADLFKRDKPGVTNYAVIPEAGHNVHAEACDELVAVVKTFLEEVALYPEDLSDGSAAPVSATASAVAAPDASALSKGRNDMSQFPWVAGKSYQEIIYETMDGIAKITINRPERRNAFTPLTAMELYDAFSVARDDSSIGVIILTGANHGGRHEDEAFCSGGDQKVRGNGGYVGDDNIPRLNILDVQRLIRVIPKPVICMCNGYSIGGGNILQILCDLTIAADTAKFGQTGPKVGSFDAGYGAGYLAAIVGQKKAREIWYLCRQYTAQEALEMGMVNTVVPFDDLEAETVSWCREILKHSATALRFMKASFNAATDGLAGLQQFGGDATLLYYTTEEAMEGRDAFKEKRDPDFSKFPKFP